MGAAEGVLRDGRRDDLDAIERLENTVFDADRLSRRALRGFLASPRTATVVATVQEVLAGYAMAGFRADSRRGRIFTLAVDPAQGRKGFGRMLLDGCEAHAMQRGCIAVRLEVRADNAAAIALYNRAGYARFATLNDYYEDGMAALRFEKPLAAA